MIDIQAVQGRTIALGRLGENNYTRILFDVSGWLADYPSASIGLLNVRPGQTTAYPVSPENLSLSDGVLYWTVTNSDLSAKGTGRCELVAYQGNTIMKSAIFKTMCLEALDGGATPPEPWESWQSFFQALADNAAQSASEVERIGEAVQEAAKDLEPLSRVTSLDNTALAPGNAIEAVGIPVYVQDVSPYAAYGITATGWYVFARVAAPAGAAVTGGTTITGAAGYNATVGGAHVDLAVRFDATAQSVPVTIAWGNVTDRFVFKASDLAARNLDYRVTFYIYDISPYATWTYALTTDTAFVADKAYYTKEGDVYTLATVTTGDAVPENTYYNHSKLHFEGMTRNVVYQFGEMVDCPIEIALPEVANDGYGAWFEIMVRLNGSYSLTLLTPSEDVRLATNNFSSPSSGVCDMMFQYTTAGGVKLWRASNTKSNL